METRDKILSKAHELYFRYGIRSVTMDEIAGQCGVSKKTIYQFFEDKDSLVTAVIEDVISKNEDLCVSDISKSLNPIHEIFLALDMMETLFSTMNSTIFFDLQKYHSKAFKILEEHKKKFIFNTIKTNLESGVKLGLYREEIRVEIIAIMRLEMCFLPFDPEIYSKTKYSFYEVQQELIEHFLYGVASPKGQKLIQQYKQERLKN